MCFLAGNVRSQDWAVRKAAVDVLLALGTSLSSLFSSILSFPSVTRLGPVMSSFRDDVLTMLNDLRFDKVTISSSFSVPSVDARIVGKICTRNCDGSCEGVH